MGYYGGNNKRNNNCRVVGLLSWERSGDVTEGLKMSCNVELSVISMGVLKK